MHNKIWKRSLIKGCLGLVALLVSFLLTTVVLAWQVRYVYDELGRLVRVLNEQDEGRPPETTMQIYFIPFKMETYLGVTMNNIEEQSIYRIWFVHESPFLSKEHPFVIKLRQMLLAKKGVEGIDDSFIRLKVESPSDTFYVDQKGRVLRKNTGEKFKLSKKQMSDIENEIEYFSGVVDIKADKKIEIQN